MNNFEKHSVFILNTIFALAVIYGFMALQRNINRNITNEFNKIETILADTSYKIRLNTLLLENTELKNKIHQDSINYSKTIYIYEERIKNIKNSYRNFSDDSLTRLLSRVLPDYN